METNSLTSDMTGTTVSNTSNKTTQESCVWAEKAVHPFFIFFFFLIFLVSLVLNTMTVRVYFCTSYQFQSSVTIYLKNLAAADFLLCLFLPLRIANYVTSSTLMRRIYCSIGSPGFYLNMYISLLFMNYIAANRYLKIVHPLQTHSLQTTCAARYISIITWTLLSGIAFTYVVIFLSTSLDPGPILYDTSCKTLHNHQINVLYKIIQSLSVLIFFFVLVSLVLLYWGILQKLSGTQASLHAKGGHHKLIRSRRNMLVLIVVFCVCFVPYHLVRLPYEFIKPLLSDCTKAQTFYIVKEVTVLFSVLSVCMDPLIYFFFCKTFRAQIALRKAQMSSSLNLRKAPVEKRQTSKILDHTETRVTVETVVEDGQYAGAAIEI